jgi:hypothetical protein
MIVFRLHKSGFTTFLITLLVTLLLSACSSGGSGASTDFLENFTTGGTDSTRDSVPSVNVSLSWVAPAEREDNTPLSLSEIAGYKLYYGTKQGQYTKSIDINDSTAQNFTFTDLVAGTYYIAVTTYDTDGRESQYSSEVKIVV